MFFLVAEELSWFPINVGELQTTPRGLASWELHWPGSPSSRFLGHGRGSHEGRSQEIRSWSRTSPCEAMSICFLTGSVSLKWSKEGFFQGPGTQAGQFFSDTPLTWHLHPHRYLGGNMPRALCACNNSVVLRSCSQLPVQQAGSSCGLSSLLGAQHPAQALAEGTLLWWCSLPSGSGSVYSYLNY